MKMLPCVQLWAEGKVPATMKWTAKSTLHAWLSAGKCFPRSGAIHLVGQQHFVFGGALHQWKQDGVCLDEALEIRGLDSGHSHGRLPVHDLPHSHQSGHGARCLQVELDLSDLPLVVLARSNGILWAKQHSWRQLQMMAVG